MTDQARQWAKRMKEIAPATHEVQTDHFVIYSAWPKSDDRHLVRIYEKLYDALCRQFDIPKQENIWIGKFPVYAFWEKPSFVEFCIEVCEIPPGMAENAGGFAGQRGEFRFVVLGPVLKPGMSKARARKWFYNLLVHESTHAFLSRFINSTYIVNWLNEGIAETLAARLVPNADSDRKLAYTHRVIKAGKAPDFRPMFEMQNIPLDPFYYGVAQSFTRYLISLGKKKFITLVELIKEGKDDKAAVAEAYGREFNDLLKDWYRRVR
jgi:hypothetical protein